MTTPSLEERMARLEGAYEQINLRLAELTAEIRALRAESNTRFLWLLGTVLGMGLTVILTVLLKG